MQEQHMEFQPHGYWDVLLVQHLRKWLLFQCGVSDIAGNLPTKPVSKNLRCFEAAP